MNQVELEHIGIIKDVGSGEIYVALKARPECTSCGAQAYCLPGTGSHERIAAVKQSSKDFAIGDRVQVSVEFGLSMAMIFLFYVLPVIIILVGTAVNKIMAGHDLLVGLITVITLLMYFVTLYYLKLEFSPKPIFKIRHAGPEEKDLA